MSKWCDEGETLVANILFKSTDPSTGFNPLYIGLYMNTSEPAEADSLTDITEPTGGTYARKSLARDSAWSVSGDEATGDQVIHAASGAAWGNVYGYFITDVASGTVGNLIAVEDFSDGPYNVGDGDSVKITPKITIS